MEKIDNRIAHRASHSSFRFCGVHSDISDSVRSYSSNTVRKYDSSASSQCKDSFDAKEPWCAHILTRAWIIIQNTETHTQTHGSAHIVHLRAASHKDMLG